MRKSFSDASVRKALERVDAVLEISRKPCQCLEESQNEEVIGRYFREKGTGKGGCGTGIERKRNAEKS